ncbi:hypothetical protein [Micromonospora costi]|uniref:Uncharacterized protein n=1 Tax=Micromonospora costi TaxID=1530042 RepID=A0A3B0A4T5_9ACTN|nr:hypothetical protein [Micromonospora costi]RKN55481.1 hypothetical protein D7193_12580 [Micromonospora costi]
MTVQGVLLVTAVVWTVSLIRPLRLRAFVSSLPLPMTAALLATGYPVDGAQLVGVVGLNVFFGLVALAHHRWRWPILVADLVGVGGYVALAAALRPFTVPFGPALAATVGLWVVAMLVLRRRPGPNAAPPEAPTPKEQPAPADESTPPNRPVPADGSDPRPRVAAVRSRPPAAAKLLLILGGAVLTGLLGQLLRGLVVTFPYAGVLVAVEVRRELPAFCRHFARNSLALVAFLCGVHVAWGQPPAVALAAGWAAFALVAAAVHLPAYWRGKHRSEATVAAGNAPAVPVGDGNRGAGR